MHGRGGFDGNIRSTPIQNFGGASQREDTDTLLRRAREARTGREAEQIKTAAATKVQALIRGYLARCRRRKQARNKFEELQKRIQSDKNPPDLEEIRSSCVLFLHGGEGGDWSWPLADLLVKHKEDLLSAIAAEDSDLCFLVRRVLGHATHILSTPDSNVGLAPPFKEVLKEFTKVSNYPQNGGKMVAKMYMHLFTKEKYFRKVLLAVLLC